MRKKLQDLRESSYERPTQPYVCGLAAEGICCPLGPDGKGRCREGAACLPILDGDRWQCGRPLSMGGPCEGGPTPDGLCCRTLTCQPVPSQRVQRGRWIIGTLAFTVGLVLVVLAASFRNEIIVPGPLSQSHAQIIRREDHSQRCASCHTSGNSSTWQMCKAALGMGEPLGPPQWELCLKCHDKTIPREHALAAHSVPRDVLDEHTRPMLVHKPNVRKAGFDVQSLSTKREELHCSHCHREHQGANHSLSAVTNSQCQTCHQQTFAGFANGHPEFDNWPYRQPAIVKFNHRSHAARHFIEARKEFSCAICHLDDPQKDAKLVASFEQACASCHQEKMQTSTSGGIVMLRLPSLDVEALAAAGEKIDWPAAATGEFEGRLPWTMQLLLSADREVAAALPKLGADADFANLQPENAEDVRTAAVIARGVRRLLDDVAARGHLAIEERLSGDGKLQRAGAFTRGLSPETLKSLASWFGKPEEQSAAIRRERIQLALFADENDLLVNEKDKKEWQNPLRGLKPAPMPVRPTPMVEVPPPAPMPVEPPPMPMPMPPAEEGSLIEPPTLPEIEPPTLEPPTPFVVPDFVEPTPAVADLLPRGIWYADSQSFTLRYVPAGHADLILVAWLQAAVPQTSPVDAARETVFAQATNIQGQGLCFQCHTPPAAVGQPIAWQPQPFERRGFTTFSHRPHLIQPLLADCTHCHQMRSAASLTSREVNFPSPHAEGDFQPMRKQSCVTCHTHGGAGESCTQCHQYHVHLDAVK